MTRRSSSGSATPVPSSLGKTNLPDFAGHGTRTESTVAGVTLNPHNVDKAPGGSSGGTATAVTASFAVLGLGTKRRIDPESGRRLRRSSV